MYTFPALLNSFSSKLVDVSQRNAVRLLSVNYSLLVNLRCAFVLAEMLMFLVNSFSVKAVMCAKSVSTLLMLCKGAATLSIR